MIKNYIKIAFRKLVKHKIDSAISIGGLAVGIACCILLVAFVKFEWSFDQFHEKSDRIYRVMQESTNPNTGEVSVSAIIPYVMASEMESTFTGIEEISRMLKVPVQMEIEDVYQSQEVLLADPGFFEIFSFPLSSGNPANTLSAPNQIVLNESKSREIFGTTDVVGETIDIRFHTNEVTTFLIAGIAEAPPSNSSITFEVVLPVESFPYDGPGGSRAWWVGFGETWLSVEENASASGFEQNFTGLVETQYDNNPVGYAYYLQPLSDIYFNQEIRSIFSQSNKLYSIVLGGIALVILAIAGINFMSLTLSRYTGRSHEIGIRKAAGADRRQLAWQFLGEVFITCSAAFLLALLLAEYMLPFFQQAVQKPVEFGLFNDPLLWMLLIGVLLVATLVTGGYPALVLSRKNASDALVSRTTSGKIPAMVKGLTVVQFTLAIVFIAMAFLMQRQMQFMSGKDLGFSPANVVAIQVDPMQGMMMYNQFAPEARRLVGVEKVSGTLSRFGERSTGIISGGTFTTLEDLEGGINIERTDEYFLETMEIDLIDGQDFSAEGLPQNEHAIIVNNRLVEVLGLENPVGETIREEGGGFFAEEKRIIGVVEDYNYRSLHYTVDPIIIQHREAIGQTNIATILVRIREGATGRTLDQLDALWAELFPGEAFEYLFVDDYVRRQYEEEQRWNGIMQAASGTAILLACFGLFGLAALAAQRRTKEIGIRKVLGATVANIVGLLSKDFVKLVLLGFVIAVPIAWYVMNRWLQDFAYRIDIGPGIFAIAGGVALLIALATVSWQSVRAAMANPVESLRSE